MNTNESLDMTPWVVSLMNTTTTATITAITTTTATTATTAMTQLVTDITTTGATTGVHEVALSLRETRFAVQTILTPLVVIFGLLGNILNILVLLQPSMRSSTNVYILVLSLADSIFLVFNFALSFLDCRKRGLSASAYYFNPYGRFVSNFSGNVAVWVTVGFTVERYIAVCHPMQGKRWCTVHRAKLASLGIVLVTLVNTLPTIFELEVVHSDKGPRCQYTSFANSFSYEMGYSWWYVTVFTFIPLICLTIFNIVLIRALFVASRKRQQLVLISNTPSSTTTTATTNTTGCNSNSNSSSSSSSSKLRSVMTTTSNGTGNKNGSGSGKGNNHNTITSSPSLNNSSNHTNNTRISNANGYNHHYPKSNLSVSDMDISTSATDNSSTHRRTGSSKGDTLGENVGGGGRGTGISRKGANLFSRSSNKDTTSSSPRTYAPASSSSYSSNVSRRQGKRMSREQNKVTLLLVTIVMIFLFCQLPWTALFLYKTYLSNNNLTGNGNHIKMAGNICNLLGLINASVNFYLYSCFSERFRKTFKSLVLFWRKRSTHFLPSMV